MENSAALSEKSEAAFRALRGCVMQGTDAQASIRFPWTEELERRRRAVARWRGNDTGLKETMTRE
jgi:hypothetical protein